MYIVYDMKDNEQCIAIFDKRKEVAKYFNTTPECISSTITKKSKRKWRYLIERITDDK